MIRNSRRTKEVMGNFGKLLNGIISRELTVDAIADMEQEEFELYKSLAKSYQEFSELSISYAEQLDEQTVMLSNLQRDMKKMLDKKPVKVKYVQ